MTKLSWWRKENIQEQEEYRLIKEIDKAREGFRRVQSWRLSGAEGEAGVHAHIPLLLTELRYRYLLGQARQRNMVNRWLYEMMDYRSG